MAQLTKSEIEKRLLSGLSVTWNDPNGTTQTLTLADAKARRLFEYLLQSEVRSPTGLPPEFVQDLYSTYSANDDPANAAKDEIQEQANGPWRLYSVTTQGFGGLNTWGGPDFKLTLDCESLFVEGPNGSGKSSLIGAVTWALSGERPRDQSDSNAHEPKPVFGGDDNAAGQWPPIACYPNSMSELFDEPYVNVCLTFRNDKGEAVKVQRYLDNGTMSEKVDPKFDVPPILIETGILMPARLTAIRLDGGRGRLTDAVQKLTGMDDLVSIGTLVSGLCHKSREYLAYERAVLKAQLIAFDKGLTNAREFLEPVELVVPDFEPDDTKDKNGEFAKLGKHLKDRAAELTKVISDDLAEGLELSSPAVQQNVIAAIGAAKEDLRSGLSAVAVWRTLDSISNAFDDDANQSAQKGIDAARNQSKEAITLYKKSQEDSRFRLKAVASQWHDEHKTGPIESCPLCESLLESDSALSKELEDLRSAGAAAARTLQDNLNRILSNLDEHLPAFAKAFTAKNLEWSPREKLSEEIRETFATHNRYQSYLTKFASLVTAGLTKSPSIDLADIVIPSSKDHIAKVSERIAIIERLIELAKWFDDNKAAWTSWWIDLAGEIEEVNSAASEQVENASGSTVPNERLCRHLDRLSDALAQAEPYRKAAAVLRESWTAGVAAKEIQDELKRRQAIADQLSPLKSLGSFAEAVARDTIERLSSRISNHLKNTLITEQLQFQGTRLERREGLVVRGGFVNNFKIDATLVANTSWIRAVLWAFLFSLREEAIEQIGSDQFPLLVFDDPQATFDLAHRHRWSQYVSSLQHGPAHMQVVLTTYDEAFLEMIKVSGMAGRQALIAAPCDQLPHAGVFEGEFLDRSWAEAVSANTPAAGASFIADVRVYVEGLLRLMLRGEDSTVLSVVSGFVIGDSREKLSLLYKKGVPPWDRPEIKTLIGKLDKGATPIKHMEISHHTGGSNLGMAEAMDVEEYWRKKLGPALNRAFKVTRDHHLLHGGLTALHSQPPLVSLPEGYRSKVRQIPLVVHGRASALSNGHVADGLFEVNDFVSENCRKVVLAQHLAYRLLAPTLEPVACPGDILIVKEVGEPTPKSLVIALSEDRILARRFEVASNHSDVAVLTAQSINPRQIAPPEIAHKATFELYKIVGVIYDHSSLPMQVSSGAEVSQCDGESELGNLLSGTFGLIEVDGRSAEPYALDGQFLIVGSKISSENDVQKLIGRPVIAADSGDNRFFKRLQSTDDGPLVLESLAGSGEYAPIILSLPGGDGNSLTGVWPVVGVLFEIPH